MLIITNDLFSSFVNIKCVLQISSGTLSSYLAHSIDWCSQHLNVLPVLARIADRDGALVIRRQDAKARPVHGFNDALEWIYLVQ